MENTTQSASPGAPPAETAPPTPPRDPWWKRLAWAVYGNAPPQVADAVSFAQYYLAAWRNRSLPLAILRGPSRAGNGVTATVLAAGKPNNVEFLIEQIFAEPPTREEIGQTPWWSLRRHVEEWKSRVDLTVARVPVVVAPRVAGSDSLITPEWLTMHIPVPGDVQDLSRASKSFADDMRLIRRNGLTSEIGSLDELDYFYEHIHAPFIRMRHGPTGTIFSARRLRMMARGGGIVWILRDGQRIAGLLIQKRGKCMRALVLGTAGNDYAHAKAGAIAALYLATVEHARQCGCPVIDFGGVHASLTDGLFRFKRKWGGRAMLKPDNHFAWTLHWQRWNPAVADFLNRTSPIFADGKNLDGLRVMDDKQSIKDIQYLSWTPGLRQFYMLNPAGWPAASTSEPHTTLLGPVDETFSSAKLREAITENQPRRLPPAATKENP